VSLLVLSGAGVVWRLRSSAVTAASAANADVARPPALERAPALAVLPLRNFSGDADYFVDGMTDALIGSLARVRGLRVISRQSVMRFRGSDRPLPEIARELGAEMLVEGTVSRVADRIRLQVKLLRAVPEETIWSDAFERPASEVLGLNAAVSNAIASAAGIERRPDAAESVPMKSVDPNLYDRILRAQYASNQLTPESLERSVALYREVLADDPGSAAAWSGLAIDYGLLGFFTLPPLEASARAKEAAKKALELDESLSDAHAALGFVLHFYDWDWPKAEAAYRRALELNPNDASSHHRLWALLAMLGRWDESQRELDTASRLDPLSISISTNVGQNLALRGDFEGAIRALERALRLEPDYGIAANHLWSVYQELGRDPERGQLLVRGLRDMGFVKSADAAAAEIAKRGYAAGLKRAAQAMSEEASLTGTASYTVAELYAAAGEQDEALAWLRRGYLERGPEMSWIAVARAFFPLRSRPEYQELMRGLRLEPQDARAAAKPARR
jgi:TolB-like protein/tetratricopeptide (TPR) repeat protein